MAEPFVGMADLYEQWSSEALSAANDQPADDRPAWTDAYEEMSSELLTLAKVASSARP